MDELTMMLLSVSSVGRAFLQVEAGKEREAQLKKQADEEKHQANVEELQRRERLNRVLSSNIVASQSTGVKGEGTPSSIALEEARDISMSEQIIGASNRLRQRSLILAGKQERKAGYMQAGATLADAAKTAAKGGL